PISFFGPSKRKTTRGALTAPARHNHSFCGLQKARNLTVSQRLPPGTLPSPPPRRVFLLPSRYGAAYVRIRGVSPRIPTLFCVRRAPRGREARFLHSPGYPAPGFKHLLEVDLRASLLELGLDLVGFVLVDAFLDRLRSAFYEVL